MNIASQWIHQIINILVNFFLIGYVLSFVGKEHYGGWASIASIIGYMTLLDAGMSFGLQHYVAHLSARAQKESLSSIFSAACAIYGVAALFALVICLIISNSYAHLFPKIPAEAATECAAALKWIALAMVFYMLNLPIQGTLLGLQCHFLRSAIEILSLLVRTGVVICTFTFIGPSLTHLGAAFLAAAVVRYILSRFALKKIEPTIRFRCSQITGYSLRQLFAFGGHSTIWTICGVITREAGPILAAVLLSAAASTYLYIGTKLVESVGTIITSAAVVFVPVASQLQARQELARLRSVLVRSVRLCMLLAFAGTGPLILFGREAIYYWVGFEDNTTYFVVVILTLGWLGYWVCSSAQAMLVGMRVLRPITAMMIFRAVASIALGIVMAHYWGVLGLATGLILPRFLATWAVVPYLACKRTDSTLKDVLKKAVPGPLFVGIAVAAISWVMRHTWVPTSLWILVTECISVMIIFGLLAIWKGLDGPSRKLILGRASISRSIAANEDSSE